MADFVDNFFGNSFDDPKSQAVMALASGLMGGDWRKGVNGYLGAMGTAGEYNSKKQLQQAQMQEMMVKAAAEKQKMEMDAKKNKMLMDMLGGGQPSQASSIGLLGDSAPQGGLLGGGAQGGGDPFAGVDKRALMLDYLQNGGKNMGGWVYDRTKPDMQVTNGYAYDKNRLGAGFMPFLNTDASGKTSMGQIGANGLPVVTAPSGALETFGAYRAIDEQAKAGSDVQQVYNKENGTMEFRTRAQIANAAQAGAPKQMPQAAPSGYNGYAGGSRDSGNAESLKILQSELSKPNISPQDRASLTREIQRVQAQSPQLAQSGAFAAAPSALEVAQTEAIKAKLVDTAKAEVAQGAETKQKGNQFSDFKSQLKAAESLLKANPTNSWIGNKADQVYGVFGGSTSGANIAKQLETISGHLVQNIPKAPGAQSNFELEQYKLQAGDVGNANIPIAQRLASLKATEQMINIWEKRVNNGEKAPQEPNASKVIDALPIANNGNKGQRIRDTSTGKILKSNGISWVAE